MASQALADMHERKRRGHDNIPDSGSEAKNCLELFQSAETASSQQAAVIDKCYCLLLLLLITFVIVYDKIASTKMSVLLTSSKKAVQTKLIAKKLREKKTRRYID